MAKAPRRLPPASVLRAGLRLRAAIARARDRMVPPEAVVVERTMAGIQSRLVGVLAELGIPDALAARPMSGSDLAESLGADPDATERVLRYLASHGLLRRSRRGVYSNSRYSELLRSDRPGSLRDWARFIGSDWMGQIVLAADRKVATGESAAKAATGQEFFEYLNSHAHARTVFDSAMQSLGGLIAPVVPVAYDFSDVRRMCDVGGGVGTTLAHVLAATPTLKGVLFDQPEVLADTPPVFGELGVSTDRVEFVAGDFFESVPSGCDLYYLQAIMHDWRDEDCLRIFGRVTEAMDRNGRILVADAVLEPDAADDFRFGTDMIMLLGTLGGRERTEAEWAHLFARAGLRELSRRTLPTLTTVFELVPR